MDDVSRADDQDDGFDDDSETLDAGLDDGFADDDSGALDAGLDDGFADDDS